MGNVMGQEVPDSGITIPRKAQLRNHWQAICARSTYDDGGDLCRLNCERATWRRKKPRGRTRGRNVTNLLATPGTTTLCPCIRAAYPAAAMSAGGVCNTFDPGTFFMPARAWNSVGTTPGHNVVTRIPRSDSSWCSDSLKDSTNALDA